MRTDDVLILGAGAAGLEVARRVRALSSAPSITLVSSSPEQVYRPWLIYTPLGHVPERMLNVSLTVAAERDRLSLVQGTATSIDPAQRRVTVGNDELGYKCLVIALGAPADRDRVPGAAEHAL